ncbi:hypothetical protein [Cycloclasticus pugetii]|uniref:hypothetical protein n=1 Tax=Cycloclasticus pugetii TaxID=34068 RepID=UPI0003747188|nr:hypothetical protein [Cycloclasticus pugetii]
MINKFTAAFLLLLFTTPVLAELIFHPLKHKQPVDVISSIKPFLQPHETVGAGYNELILRVDPQNLSDIKRLIERLDQPAHRLVIHVNRDGQFNQQTKGYNVNSHINIDTRHNAKSAIDGELKIYSTKDQSNEKNNQSIQVLEGHTAYISDGVSEPVNSVHIQQYNNHHHISASTDYREASNGFYVTPRLSNDSVILDIAPWYEEALSENRTSAHFTRASSVIRGRLNTWIKLTGIDEITQQTNSKILGSQSKTSIKNNTIWIKIVDLDAQSTQ